MNILRGCSGNNGRGRSGGFKGKLCVYVHVCVFVMRMVGEIVINTQIMHEAKYQY